MRLPIALGLLVAALPATAVERQPPLVPWPAEIAFGPGALVVGSSFRVAITGPADPRVERAARRLESRLLRQVGLPPSVGAQPPALEIRCAGPGKSALPALGMDESYTLEVTSEKALLQAREPWGILRGMETFLQLVEPSADGFRVGAAT